MDPMTLGAAGIMGGTQLIGGLLAQAAQAAREKKAREAEMMQAAYNTQMQGQQAMGQGQAQGFQSLVNSYKEALARPPIL